MRERDREKIILSTVTKIFFAKIRVVDCVYVCSWIYTVTDRPGSGKLRARCLDVRRSVDIDRFGVAYRQQKDTMYGKLKN